MVKNLLLLVAFLAHLGTISAQTDPSNKVVLQVAANAKSVKFSFSLTQKDAKLACNFGENEENPMLSQDASKEITVYTYTFKTPLSNERTITIGADNLKMLRVSNSKDIVGVQKAKSPVLHTLNIDFTSLVNHSLLDVSQCPELQILTLVSTGVTDLKLPKSNKFKELQVSPDISGKGFLNELNLSTVPNLQVLSITGYNSKTLDVTNNKKLVKLQVYSPKTRLCYLKGAKDLKLLTDLNVSGNSLTFDQIPDMVADGANIDNFKYGNQGTFKVPDVNIKDYTVDLSELLFQKGISKSKEKTVYTWFYKRHEKDTWTAVPEDKMEEIAGVFTFKPELSDDSTIRLYVRATNNGYPGIGTKGNNYIASYIIRLTPHSTGINALETQNIQLIHTEQGFTLETNQTAPATVYTIQGVKVWNGTLPATVLVPKGTYIVKLNNGKSIKVQH